MRRAFLLILIVLLVLVGLFLGGLNDQPISINYYYGSVETPVAVALLLGVLAGIVMGALAVYLGSVLPLMARNRRLRRQVEVGGDPDAERLTADR